MPADLQALFALVPPGQILFASDAPYGATGLSAAFQLRIALQAGLSAEQIRVIASEQSLRIAAGEELIQAGPAVGERERAPHTLLDRVAEFLMVGTLATMRGSDAGVEMLALARLACDVPAGDRRRAGVRRHPRADGRLRRRDGGRAGESPAAGVPDPGADRRADAGRSDPGALSQRGTRPPSAPGSLAGPRGEAIASTRIAFRPSESFSRPSVEETSRPVSSRTRSNR